MEAKTLILYSWRSIRTAFRADRAEVSMLEIAGSMALTYISRLSMRVRGNLVKGLNKG